MRSKAWRWRLVSCEEWGTAAGVPGREVVAGEGAEVSEQAGEAEVSAAVVVLA